MIFLRDFHWDNDYYKGQSSPEDGKSGKGQHKARGPHPTREDRLFRLELVFFDQSVALET